MIVHFHLLFRKSNNARRALPARDDIFGYLLGFLSPPGSCISIFILLEKARRKLSSTFAGSYCVARLLLATHWLTATPNTTTLAVNIANYVNFLSPGFSVSAR